MENRVLQFFNILFSKNFSMITLILSNMVLIAFAVLEDWSITAVMWIYWCQSAIIGLVNFGRILDLDEFSTEGYEINDRKQPETPFTKYKTAIMFITHYGIFHYIYYEALLAGHGVGSTFPRLKFEEMHFAFITVVIFGINHFVSYFLTKKDYPKKPNIGSIMMFPYARIIPFHFTAFLIAMIPELSAGLLVIFLTLKTVADVAMHYVENEIVFNPDSKYKGVKIEIGFPNRLPRGK